LEKMMTELITGEKFWREREKGHLVNTDETKIETGWEKGREEGRK
jgi:hypothetical protein